MIPFIDAALFFMSIRREELGRSRAESLPSPDPSSNDSAELFYLDTYLDTAGLCARRETC